MIESGQNPNAIGDNYESLGILQIQEAYVIDASSYANANWTHEDALDEDTAIKIFYAYMYRYATKERLGREPTLEDIARIHNGGPNGYLKLSTIKYWNKVKQLYDKHHNICSKCWDR